MQKLVAYSLIVPICYAVQNINTTKICIGIRAMFFPHVVPGFLTTSSRVYLNYNRGLFKQKQNTSLQKNIIFKRLRIHMYARIDRACVLR